MDLYIQVGVVLLLLSALSLFIYFYTQPSEQFNKKIESTTKEINSRLETTSGANVSDLLMARNITGSEVKKLIKDAPSNKLGIFLHTINQKGLIVNYGYQLREPEINNHLLIPNGRAGTTSTEFEKSFVSTINSLSDPLAHTNSTKTSLLMGSEAIQGMNLIVMDFVVKGHDPTRGYGDKVASVPSVSVFEMSSESTSSSLTKGENSPVTGFLYTSNILREDFPINDNLSYLNEPTSVYYLSDKYVFDTTLIRNMSGKIIGVYIEEQNVNNKIAVMQELFKRIK